MDQNDPNRQNPNRNSGEGQNPQQPFDYREHYQRQNDSYHRGNPYQAPNGFYGAPPKWQQSNQPPYTAPGDSTKTFSILSYVGILWIVGLLADRNNPIVKFHVNQGIILSIFEFILGIVLSIAKAMISAIFIQTFSWTVFIPRFGMAINGLLSFAGWCLVLVFSIMGIIRASQGRREPLPLIGRLFTVIQ